MRGRPLRGRAAADVGKALGFAMSSYELVNRLPVVPILIVIVALVAYGTFSIYMRNRDQKGVTGQMLLYSFLAVLFLIDVFFILKRDGFRASWTLTFWLALAAFMVGERVGRWNSSVSDADAADQGDALK
jgi:drug/metabolite transporter (DMT)-like permease